MAKRIYEPCGKFSLASNNTFEVKTYLPTSVSNYRYVRYYNISTSQHYGILGVLVHDGTNYDLSSSTGLALNMSLEQHPINLNNLDTSFSNVSFKDLKKEDVITFICFHDDDFVKNNNKYKILDFYQSNLPKFYDFPKPVLNEKPTWGNKNLENNKGIEAKEEPMVGNGGILTFTGSCI